MNKYYTFQEAKEILHDYISNYIDQYRYYFNNDISLLGKTIKVFFIVNKQYVKSSYLYVLQKKIEESIAQGYSLEKVLQILNDKEN